MQSRQINTKDCKVAANLNLTFIESKFFKHPVEQISTTT